MTTDPEETIPAPNGDPPVPIDRDVTYDEGIPMIVLRTADGGEVGRLIPLMLLGIHPKQVAILRRVPDEREGRITVRRVGVSEDGLPRFLVTAVRRLKPSS